MHRLSSLVERLVRGGVDFVLIGGYAAVVHGASFVTRDVDICVDLSSGNLRRLRAALEGLHPRHRMTPAKLAFEINGVADAGLKNLYLETDLGILDCLGEVLGLGGFDQIKALSVAIDFPFGRCHVLTLDGLIKAKEAMGRPHDKLTVAQLKAIRERRQG